MVNKINSDEIDSICLKLHDFLVNELGCSLDEYDDYEYLSDFLHEELLIEYVDPTVDRNYN